MLADFGRTFLRLITSAQALAIFRVVTAESERIPELGRVFYDSGPRRWTHALAAYLSDQNRQGVLLVRHPEAAAAQFLALVKGPVHMRLTLGVGPRPDGAEIAAVVDSAVDVFLRGYRAGPRAIG